MEGAMEETQRGLKGTDVRGGRVMQRSITVRGRISDPHHIELDEPVSGIRGEVEVVVKPAEDVRSNMKQDIFDFICGLPPGRRSRTEIDKQVRKERETWGNQ